MSSVDDMDVEKLCEEQEVMLSVSWIFSVFWFLLFLVWCGVLVASCRARRVRCLQTLMLIVPFFHLGDAVWQLWTYTHCTCMRCSFGHIDHLFAWLGTQYAFSLGRLTALLLCLFLIATGAGTVRRRLLARNWVQLVVCFIGFVGATAFGLPLTVVMLGTDHVAAFVWSLVFYASILVSIFFEAYANSRVLKAHLVRIREHGIAPRTTPAFAKFRLFTRLRRWVVAYFVLHTFIIIAQMVRMELYERVVLLVVWELTQIGVTSAIAYAFRAGGGGGGGESAGGAGAGGAGDAGGAGAGGAGGALEREALLREDEVATPLVTAQEVSLGWNDLGSMQSVQEDGQSAPLRPWSAGTAVPPPPRPLAIIEVFASRRTRGRGVAATRTRTVPTAAGGEAALEMAAASPDVPPVVDDTQHVEMQGAAADSTTKDDDGATKV